MGSSQGCKSYLPKVHSRIYYTKYMVVQISLIFRSFRTSSICSSLVLVSMEFVWEPRYSTAREIKSWVCFSYISLVLSHLQGNNFRLFLAVFISKVLPLTFLRIKFHFLGLFDSGRIHSDAQTFLKSACLTKGSSCKWNETVVPILTGYVIRFSLANLSPKKYSARWAGQSTVAQVPIDAFTTNFAVET